MAIRDGMAVDLEKARTEPVVKKGRIKYVPPPPQSRARRTSMLLAALALALILVGAVYIVYSQRDAADTLSLKLEKTAFSPGEDVNVSVSLVNPGGKAHGYDLPTPQLFGLEIINDSGDVVTEYVPDVQGNGPHLTIGPGETLRLGDFSWNQTIHVLNGMNESWAQAPSGDYTIKAYFKGSADIAAEKRITIG